MPGFGFPNSIAKNFSGAFFHFCGRFYFYHFLFGFVFAFIPLQLYSYFLTTIERKFSAFDLIFFFKLIPFYAAKIHNEITT